MFFIKGWLKVRSFIRETIAPDDRIAKDVRDRLEKARENYFLERRSLL